MSELYVYEEDEPIIDINLHKIDNKIDNKIDTNSTNTFTSFEKEFLNSKESHNTRK